KQAKKIPIPAPEDDPYYIKACAVGFSLKEANMSHSTVSKSRTGTTSNTTSKHDTCRADKIVAEEESCEKASKASTSKTKKSKAGASKTEKSEAGASKTQPKKSKANVSAPMKSSKAGMLEVKSGKVFKPMVPKENDKATASNSVKKITCIKLDEDSEEELLAKTHKLLAAPSVPLPTTSPSKSPCMAFEGVVLKSPALVKPKPNKPPAKQQQLMKTPAHVPELIETDKEQEPALPKRTACPKLLPLPACEPEIESQPDSTADKACSNKCPPHDLTPESEPEPEAKWPKSTSSKAQKHSPTPKPKVQAKQAPKETKPDPEPSKQKKPTQDPIIAIVASAA
ncbi:hypothetical protein FRC11_000107, partial [Ceratobasidium sp. 423]